MELTAAAATSRYRRARPPTLPNVLLRVVKLGSHSWYAYTGSWGTFVRSITPLYPISSPVYECAGAVKLAADVRTPATEHRNSPLANRQPIPERSDQQREREQIHPVNLHQDGAIVLRGRRRLVLRGRRTQLDRAAPKAPLAVRPRHARPPRALRGRGLRRRAERVPDAGRGDAHGHRRVPRPVGAGQAGAGRAGEGGERRPEPREEPQGRDAGRGRDRRQPRAQLHPHHDGAAADPRPAAAHRVAEAEAPVDVAHQLGFDPRHELFGPAACAGCVPAEGEGGGGETRGGVSWSGWGGRFGCV